jgi:hypothetical protein
MALWICVVVFAGCGCGGGTVRGSAGSGQQAKVSEAGSGAKPSNPSCPKCKSSKGVIPIAYGLPSLELGESADRGEVVLGGCVVGDDSPEWHCKTCKKNW